MPIVIDPPLATPVTGAAGGGAPDLVIGLVNNMPDSALEGTESQFTALLAAASAGRVVHLRLAALPEVPRGAEAGARIAARYWSIDDLMASPPDALIVTGTEPRAASLPDEPYWSRMLELLAFAESATVSSIWSCLAAHVAVLALDGIERRRLAEKRCGVFGHRVLHGHPLTGGLTSPHPVPHSRWNDLRVAELEAAGYTILMESSETGADAFVMRRRSLLLFLQGHPEYEERTLLKEYQRDVHRFLSGQLPRYPTLPFDYFDAEAVRRLREFEHEATAGGISDPAKAFPFTAIAATLTSRWRAPAARMYANWLDYVAEHKATAGTAARYAL